jgi:hypothetical protein
MLIGVDQPLSIRITLVVVGEELEVFDATLVRLLADRLLVRTPLDLPVGTRVIARLGDGDHIAGRVLDRSEGEIAISKDLGRVSDARAAPRATGELAVRWRLDRPNARFRAISGPSEVSISGIRFETPLPGPEVGDPVRLEIDREHLARGIVRRVSHLSSARVSVAVELVDVPEATLDVLSDFTLASG